MDSKFEHRVKKRIHVISVGGGVMHALAIHLHEQGHIVTGSDDVIYDPSRTKLERAGLLPERLGWSAQRVTSDIDLILVGMHAKPDNPELQEAQRLGLNIYDYPSYIAQVYAEDKQRIVVAGSHGKTSTTAMIMHVLKSLKYSFDYLIGYSTPGFESNISLSQEASIIVIEGDEYPSGPQNLSPKFIQYRAHIGVITGLAWDHVNHYPSPEDYVGHFRDFVQAMDRSGILIYNQIEDELRALCTSSQNPHVELKPYSLPKYRIQEEITYVLHGAKAHPLKIFGKHNLLNIAAAATVCRCLAVSDEEFYQAIESFPGVDQRLKRISTHPLIYRDFAHAPTKAEASTEAVKEQHPQQKLAAILEMHTFSSFNEDFILLYKNRLRSADLCIIYVNPEVLKLRGSQVFEQDSLRKIFAHKNLLYVKEAKKILSILKKETDPRGWTYLFMSSGHMGNISFPDLKNHLVLGDQDSHELE
ncbi:MAG: Mur ligase family protein [Cytophagales bacterium]|nr:Mur ligase family protein [Cytophagales bacterium]